MNSLQQNKHTNKAGRFPISKLSQSHPEFFDKKKKKNVNNIVSKSMGGGFSAKINPPTAVAKSPAKKAPEPKVGKKKGKANEVKKEEKSGPIETPKLTEVNIREFQISVERRVFNFINVKTLSIGKHFLNNSSVCIYSFIPPQIDYYYINWRKNLFT